MQSDNQPNSNAVCDNSAFKYAPLSHRVQMRHFFGEHPKLSIEDAKKMQASYSDLVARLLSDEQKRRNPCANN
jgi:hypothetical protein